MPQTSSTQPEVGRALCPPPLAVDYDALYEELEPHLQKVFGPIIRRSEVCPFLVFVDIDGFAGLNKKFGAAICDAVLWVVERLVREVAATNFATRFGGDQFVVTAAGPNEDAAHKIAESILKKIAEYGWDSIVSDLYVYVSVGFARFRGGEPNKDWLLRAIRGAAMAKQAGGNRVSEGPQFLHPSTSRKISRHCS